MSYMESLSHFIPEICVVVALCLGLMVEATVKRFNQYLVFILAQAGLVVAIWQLFQGLSGPGAGIFFNSLSIDPFSQILKIILLVSGLGIIHLGQISKDIYGELKSEFAVLVMAVLAGGMVLISANNFLVTYIGIETLSILSYALAAFKKNDDRSSEAGLKYALYGGVASGVMLFGIGHIYGIIGTIDYTQVYQLIGPLADWQKGMFFAASLLFLVGLAFKVTCFPFHMWAPDVYEGSPLPVTAFFSIVPKLAALAALLRFSLSFFPIEQDSLRIGWGAILSVGGILTMTVGNITAIGQKSVKRMLAYSSISHAGMMLLGVVVFDHQGVRALVFYAITYIFMTLVAFYILGLVADEYDNDHFDRFNGLIHRHPVMAITMTVVMLSLAGIPPLSGFVAKFNILAALVSKKYITIAIIAGINSVISLFYYLKIIRHMVFRPVDSAGRIGGLIGINQGIIVTLAVPVVLLGIFWEKILLLGHGAKIIIR